MGEGEVRSEAAGGPPEGRLKSLISSIKGRAKTWWHTRAQKDLATASIAVSSVDFTPWADDIADFIHWKHWHSALHLLFMAGVYWRATQVGKK